MRIHTQVWVKKFVIRGGGQTKEVLLTDAASAAGEVDFFSEVNQAEDMLSAAR